MLVLAAVARLPWVFMTPMTEAPDEHTHLWVAHFLYDHNRLPHVKDVLDAGIIAVYGSLPQIGYLPHILIAHLLSFCGPVISFRFGSVLLGIAAVGIAYGIGRELFPADRIRRLALPLLMVFHPQLAFVNAYTNTDSTVCVLGAAIVLLSIRLLKRVPSMLESLVLGLLLGFLALTKYSAYSLFFAVAFAFCAALLLHSGAELAILRSVVITGSAALLSCGWWFVRQHREYPNDILGTKTMYNSWATRFHKPLTFNVGVWTILSMPAYWQLKFQSYWGLLGHLNRFLWQPFYYLYGMFMMLATAGGVYSLVALPALLNSVSLMVQRKSVERNRKEKLRLACILAMFIIAVLVNISSMVWAASVNLGLAQGRYLFGVETPILLLMIYGLSAFGEKFKKVAIVALVLANFGAWLWAIATLAPVYKFHLQI